MALSAFEWSVLIEIAAVAVSAARTLTAFVIEFTMLWICLWLL